MWVTHVVEELGLKCRQSKGEGKKKMERKVMIDSVIDRLFFVVFRWKLQVGFFVGFFFLIVIVFVKLMFQNRFITENALQ